MINILSFTLLISFFKLLIEESLLGILMIMEMTSMLSFFLVLSLNTEVMGLTSCTISMLSILISESVLSLTIFISLMRISTSEKITSFSLNY
nr:NADH dehydrogenase subunit 4L [Myrsidea ptilorhynchi]